MQPPGVVTDNEVSELDLGNQTVKISERAYVPDQSPLRILSLSKHSHAEVDDYELQEVGMDAGLEHMQLDVQASRFPTGIVEKERPADRRLKTATTQGTLISTSDVERVPSTSNPKGANAILNFQLKERLFTRLMACAQLALAIAVFLLSLLASHTIDSMSAGAWTLLIVFDVIIVLSLVVAAARMLCSRFSPCLFRNALLFGVWALSLLLSLTAGNRLASIFGTTTPNQSCEEGSSILWIAILVACAGCLEPELPSWTWGILALTLAIQHLIVGFTVPRPECRVPHTGSGLGVLLGLEPFKVGTLQLSLLAICALLSANRQSCREAELLTATALDFLQAATPEEGLTALQEMQRDSESLLSRQELVSRLIAVRSFQVTALVNELEQTLQNQATNRVWLQVLHFMAMQFLEIKDELSKDGSSQDLTSLSDGNDQKLLAETLPGWLGAAWLGQSGKSKSKSTLRNQSIPTSPGRQAQEVEGMKRTLVRLPADEFQLGSWDFDALLAFKSTPNVLQAVGTEFLTNYDVLPLNELCLFLSLLESGYRDSPYHNSQHAADVCNSFYYLASKSQMWNAKDISTYSRAAMLIAALGHDVGHFGRTNLFLIKTCHAYAVNYNDRSVLECFHSATLARLLEQTNLLALVPRDHRQTARQWMITLILSTDVSKHMEDLSALRLRLQAENFDPVRDSGDQQKCLTMFIRAADLGHSAKPLQLHQDWSNRVIQEFHDQGDEEKRLGIPVSPLCDRDGFDMPASQVGFLQFLCIPMWKELALMEDLLEMKSNSTKTPQALASPSGRRRSFSGLEPSTSQDVGATKSVIGRRRNSLSVDKTETLMNGDRMRPQPGLAVVPIKASRFASCLAQCEENLSHWKQLSSKI